MYKRLLLGRKTTLFQYQEQKTSYTCKACCSFWFFTSEKKRKKKKGGGGGRENVSVNSYFEHFRPILPDVRYHAWTSVRHCRMSDTVDFRPMMLDVQYYGESCVLQSDIRHDPPHCHYRHHYRQHYRHNPHFHYHSGNCARLPLSPTSLQHRYYFILFCSGHQFLFISGWLCVKH